MTSAIRLFQLFFFTALVFASNAGREDAWAEDLTASKAIVIAQSKLSEKEAYEAAKDLGTLEAWEAFLLSYPKGFFSDLARAHVKKLSREDDARPASRDDNEPVRPSPPPVRAEVPPEPALSTVDLGPASSRWRNGSRRFSMSQGRSLYTATVQAKGVELVTYCKDNNMSGGFGFQLGAVIRGNPRGVYPQFRKRVNQGLDASSERSDNGLKEIGISFSNGEAVFAGVAAPTLIDGELEIGSVVKGFGANSGDLENMMAAQSMTVSLPPFSSTFQLNGSRKAICSVMKRCGASPPGCGSGGSTVVGGGTIKCSGGRIYSRRQRDCVCPNSRPFFRGGKCRKGPGKVKKCPPGFERVNGRCLRNDELNNPNDICGPGFRMVNGQCIHQNNLQQRPKKCPPGMERVNGKCRRNDELSGPQSVCGPGFRMVNGQCIHQNNLPQNQPQNNNNGCPPGTQRIGNNCVNVKQIQQNLKNIFSDVRLKRDITPVATLDNGLKLYSFRYLWDDARLVGVMAQDLLHDESRRDAVRMSEVGYYMVDYERLGVKMISLDEWRAKGASAVMLEQK